MNNKDYHENLYFISHLSVSDFLKETKIPSYGLNKKQVEENRKIYGSNGIINNKKKFILKTLYNSFINSFSVMLFIICVISFITALILPESNNFSAVIIIFLMILISGILRFIQELKSKKITNSLINLVPPKVKVYREGVWDVVSGENIVKYDTISLKAGDKVPADIRITKSENLFVSQSEITGESEIQSKNEKEYISPSSKVTDCSNLLFLGSTVTGGECEGIVMAVGKHSIYGSLNHSDKKKTFNKSSSSITKVLIKFMILLLPIVFIASGITKGNWLTAFLFALSAAVGLTPELLPLVITACLTKGSYNMKKKETIVKNINAMQNLGSIDTLCVDKTGTLTKDKLIPEYYMDILGNESSYVLDMAYLNSYYSGGIKNHIDLAILRISEFSNNKEYYNILRNNYTKYKEIPFDYSKKISGTILKKINQDDNNYLLIAKGDVKNILDKCSYVEYKSKVIPISDNEKEESVNAVLKDMKEDGMKVIAIAKKNISILSEASIENNLILIGYIAFFDSPKQSAQSAIEKLKALNVNIKVLTGDNKDTTVSVCKRLDIETTNVITGKELDLLSDNDIQSVIENTTIFTELTPKQKANIIQILKDNGHKVGFLGDGINDLPAITQADVGISVNTASPTIKEMADVVLLKKDLGVLEQGILEGRRAFQNMSKYIKITASSNFGNIFAIFIAGIILPFFPMTSTQILLLNILYDILCLALPWDNTDKNLCSKPLDWEGKKLESFMLFFGPVSSFFDIITFMFLAFVFCPILCNGQFNTLSFENQNYYISLFQTGWFLESMWTQVLIIHLLRSKRLSFRKEDRPSIQVFITSILGILLCTLITVTPARNIFGFTPMPFVYYIFIILIVIFYMLVITLAKKIFIKKNKNLF